MNKKEAMEYLGISERGIERAVKSGRLKAHYEPSKTGKRLIVEQENADTFKAEMEAPTPVEPTPEPGPSSTALARLPMADGGGAMVSVPLALLEKFSASVKGRRDGLTVPVEARLMLSIDEAVIYSGISRSAIIAAIREGKLVAYIGYGRGRRLKREAVEQWVKGL